MQISVSDPAIDALLAALPRADDTALAGVRVGVLPGGCSGLQYFLSVEGEPLEDDLVVELARGLRLFVDPFSRSYLDGIRLDHHKSLMGDGFVFENPNASGGCGCGSSFTT
jgi:iron-sulfur cluster assembly accessory protein